MKNYRKSVFCSILAFTISMAFMAGCGGKVSHSKKINSTKVTQTESSGTGAFSDKELKSISNDGEVCLADDSFASIWWIPKSNNSTLSKIALWLKRAKVYNGKIPSSQTNAVFCANIAPSTLYLNTSDKYEITIQPAWYLVSNGTGYKKSFLKGVVKFINGKQVTYLRSNELFDWLKNDKWKPEFKTKH